jgi:hypothetical protein
MGFKKASIGTFPPGYLTQALSEPKGSFLAAGADIAQMPFRAISGIRNGLHGHPGGFGPT